MLRSDSPNLNKSEFDQDLIGLESDENWTLPIYLYIYIYTPCTNMLSQWKREGEASVLSEDLWNGAIVWITTAQPDHPPLLFLRFLPCTPQWGRIKLWKLWSHTLMLTKFMFSFFFKSGHWVFTNYVQNIYKIFTEHLDNIYNILCHTFLQNFKLLLHLFSLCSLVFLIRLLFNRC